MLRPARSVCQPLAAALLLLAASALLPAMAAAQTPFNAAYVEGTYGFHYRQLPWGSYQGDFAANGPALPTGILPEPGTEGCGGAAAALGDTMTVWGYGAVVRPDSTVDAALLILRQAGGLTTGNHPVTAQNLAAMFFLLDGASGFALPPDFDPTRLQDWLATLQADHRFASLTGAIRVDEATPLRLRGTFSGVMLDAFTTTLISVTNGTFDFVGLAPAGVGDAPAAVVMLGAFPKPFNPRTTISLELPAPQRVTLAVYDLAGRRVRTLCAGQLGAGLHPFAWDGADASGQPRPAGVYLARAVGAGWTRSLKVTLLP